MTTTRLLFYDFQAFFYGGPKSKDGERKLSILCFESANFFLSRLKNQTKCVQYLETGQARFSVDPRYIDIGLSVPNGNSIKGQYSFLQLSSVYFTVDL